MRARNRASRSEMEKFRTDAAPDPLPLLLTIPQVAQLLSVGRTTVYYLISRGELDTVHIGRSARIAREAVEQFVRRRQLLEYID